MTCMCVECVGDQPEAGIFVDIDGKFYIYYKDKILTDGYIRPAFAWFEFDYRCKRGLWK